jgi:phage/plasmid-like protein (TIGR03299 family)
LPPLSPALPAGAADNGRHQVDHPEDRQDCRQTVSHQIETHGTSAAAVFARTDAWHRLGTTLTDVFTAEQAMTVGHLGGWNVRKTPLHTSEISPDGVSVLEVPGHFATVRTNPFTGATEPLGVVGEGYRPIQNEEHCDILNRLVDDSGAIFDTAGSLRGGRQVFVSLQLPETMRVGGSDEVNVNIVALNSHDGTSAFRLLVTPVRVVCANTQAAALANHSASISIRHTASAKARVAAARDALGLTFRYLEAFQAQAEAMIQQAMTEAEFQRLTAELFPAPDRDAGPRTQTAHKNREYILTRLWADADTQAGIRGTKWAGYQAVAEYIDHHSPVRTRGDKATARAARLLTTTEPTRLKTRAWQLANS